MPAPDRAWPNNRSLTCCAALVLAGPPPQSKGGPATCQHARCMQVPARIAALQRRHCMALALKLPLTLTRTLPSFVLTVLASAPTMTLTVTRQLHLDQSTPLSDLRGRMRASETPQLSRTRVLSAQRQITGPRSYANMKTLARPVRLHVWQACHHCRTCQTPLACTTIERVTT